MNNDCFECGGVLKPHQEDYPYDSLPGAIIKGVTVWRCQGCEEWEVELPRIASLNRALAGILLRKPARLTGDEMRFLRKYLGLSGADLARKMDVAPATVSRWEQGRTPISQNKDRFLRLMVATEQPVRNYFAELESVATQDPEPTDLCIEDRSGEWRLCPA